MWKEGAEDVVLKTVGVVLNRNIDIGDELPWWYDGWSNMGHDIKDCRLPSIPDKICNELRKFWC